MIEKLIDDADYHWTKATATGSKAEMNKSVLMYMVARLRYSIRTSSNPRQDVLNIIDNVDKIMKVRTQRGIRT